MRVVMVGCESFSTRPGGLNRYFEDLASALRRTGCDVDLVLPGNTLFGSRVPRSLRTALRVLHSLWQVARCLHRTDVVDVHFALYGVASVWLARLFRKPVVVHFQGPWAQESEVAGKGTRWMRSGKRFVERSVYRQATVCIVLSDAFRRLLVDTYGVADDRVVVVRPGVDLRRFHLGDDGGLRPRLAFAARRLDPRMGLDVAVEAWPAVLGAKPDAQLLIAGDGHERDHLQAQIDRLGVSSAVTLLGRVDDEELVRLYQRARVSLVPTRLLEGFGLVAIESLACGTPAIVSDVDALPEFMAELDPTLVVPRDHAAALAARIILAFEGMLPGRAECRAFAETFTWERVAERHLDIYRNARPTPAPEEPPRSVAMLALEWPGHDDGGGGVARLNHRLAAQLVADGLRVDVVTFAGGVEVPGVRLRTMAPPRGRLDRYYRAPLRARGAVRRVGADRVIALGDDWPMLGVRRARLFTGSSRAEARSSTGLRRLNHGVLAGLEYATSLDPVAVKFTIGPDLPRRGMAARTFVPVPGLALLDPPVLNKDGRRGIAFVGPPTGRKRGELALAVLAALADHGANLELSVYTSRPQDALFWSGRATVHVGLDDAALAEALCRHAFLLSTSAYEGFGIPTVEAMAVGCVPVVTRTPGAVAIMTGELNSLVGPINATAFTAFARQRILELWGDAAQYAACQQQGFDRAAELIRQGDARHLLRVR